jgi:AcrR family transcriptional regulator
MKANGTSSTLPARGTEERLNRIVTAALEVFSEYSFQDATTDEVARRARVSKRDIYASFPNKHALLIAVIVTVLEKNNENLSTLISLTVESASLQGRLEVIGLALANEVLSPVTSFLARLIPSESIHHAVIGTIYFENGFGRRCKMIREILSSHTSTSRGIDLDQAAEHYLALITHLPYLNALMGMSEIWDSKATKAHVRDAVGLFLRAYPALH